MYELKDSHFVILDTQTLVIGGAVIGFAVMGFFLLRSRKRGNHQ